MSTAPRQGEIWEVDLDPVRGHEQAGSRPALVISVDRFNQGPAGLVIAAPLTSVDRRQPLHVALDPPEGGVRGRSFVKAEDVRSISTERLLGRWGSVEPATLRAVVDRVRILIHC
jgi:mRNA interferase MazF